MKARGKERSVADVDNQLQQWRQGDFSRDRQLFIFAENLDSNDVSCEDAEHGIHGMVMLTQTCDIVRSASKRQYIEICPLVELTEEMYALVRKGTSPQFAIVPGVAGERLVADLDRVMTATKGLVAGWNREQGCRSDEERIRFAEALERKRGRFAFPTDFSDSMRKFRDHIFDKHRKPGSEAGQAYRDLDEIRVRASPSWDSSDIELTFYFVISSDRDRSKIAPHVETLLEKADLPKKYKWSDPPYHLATLDDLTAREYQESVSLDFEILSLG